MSLPAPVNGRPGGEPADPAPADDLAVKPVLEWTSADWARWAAGGPAATATAPPPPPPAPTEEPSAARAWWAARALAIDPPAALAPDAAAEVQVAPEPQGPVAPAAAAPRSRVGVPAHRRRPAAGAPGRRRLRAAAELAGVSVIVGAVLASLVTVALFLLTVALQGLSG